MRYPIKDLRNLDLNLLLVFQHLLEQRNISAVARLMGLSQPAASNALRRLRQAFGDDLFVRTAQGMQPTPLAERLAEPVGEALALLTHMLAERVDFDPAASSRRFRIAMSDVGEIHFMPTLMQRCAQLAPHVRIDSVRLTGAQLRREMESGRVDLAIGAHDDMGAGLFQRMLFRQGYLTLYRRGHPRVRASMTRKAFAAESHLIVSHAAPYGQINQALERAGVVLDRHCSVPHFGAVPYIVASTDLLATVPEKLAQDAAMRFGLRTFEPPIDAPSLQTNLFWPRRLHRDPANQWLRGLIVETFSR